MATKIFLSRGRVSCVYDDRFRPLLEALGYMEVERASNVEFNSSTGEWEAKRPDGQLIAKGLNREDVIAREIKWLEENPRYVAYGDD